MLSGCPVRGLILGIWGLGSGSEGRLVAGSPGLGLALGLYRSGPGGYTRLRGGSTDG